MIVRKSTEIYLDSNATTAVLPAAAQAAREAMEDVYGNPSSSHISGLKARDILESARELCRDVLGARDGQIVFTSGATEAIQMGVFSTLCHVREQRLQASTDADEPRLLLYGATEHKAVPQAIQHWNHLLGIGNRIVEIPVDEQGQLDLEFIREHAANADLICTMAVNNETGVTVPLDDIESAIREENESAMWLVDCVQAVGKFQLSLSETTVDYAAVSGHKIYAPKGIGLLYVRKGSPLVPLLAGGGQEHGARGGTENLPGVAAIAAVLDQLAQSDTKTFAAHQQLLANRKRIVTALKQAFPSIVFNTPFESSVPTTINFAVEGFQNKELLDLFDAAGIRVSSGSACGSRVVGSYVLDAMGLPKWRSEGAIRMSFGPLTGESEIIAACERIEEAGRALCDSCRVLPVSPMQSNSEPVDGLVQLKNGSMCTWCLMDAETGNAIIVDPFEELSSRAESLIRCQQSNVLAILDSHAHVDHDSCRSELLAAVAEFAAPSAQTDDLLGWPAAVDGVVSMEDGTTAPFLQFSSKWIIAQVELPGHTKIGRVYLVGTKTDDGRLPADQVELAFTGDMVLMGGIGRTDFPCSAIDAMYSSLRRLCKLIAPTTILCPTHDYNNEFATTMQRERDSNPFLSSIVCDASPISLETFLKQKPEIDQSITDETNSELICGLIKGPTTSCESALEIPRGELKAFFGKHREAWIIDVREPHEFSFAQDWSELGFETPPKNVPLTRLAGFLPAMVRMHNDAARDVIFLCRSGRRSGVAASVARRLGVTTAKHIAGGIALNVSTRCVADDWSEPGYMI
ncbi:MAG: aminotransferase class V-fold PLP-dependent enzyme [Planctomycetota bacterium]